MTFPWPWLSDFSYGEFVFHSWDGKQHVYSNGIEDPAWDNIKFYFDALAENNPKDAQRSKRFQWIVTECIDTGESVKWTQDIICPHCLKRPLHYGPGAQYFDQEIPIASFSAFMLLEEQAKRQRIAELYAESFRKMS